MGGDFVGHPEMKGISYARELLEKLAEDNTGQVPPEMVEYFKKLVAAADYVEREFEKVRNLVQWSESRRSHGTFTDHARDSTDERFRELYFGDVKYLVEWWKAGKRPE